MGAGEFEFASDCFAGIGRAGAGAGGQDFGAEFGDERGIASGWFFIHKGCESGGERMRRARAGVMVFLIGRMLPSGW